MTEQVYQLDIGLSPPLAYPVAAGLAARHLGCELQLSLSLFLQSFIGNLISVVVRGGATWTVRWANYPRPINAGYGGTS